MKKVVLFFALIVGLLASATTQAQTVNMSRYITLTVTNGAAIKLNFNVATNGTPVRIVSGSNTQDITVNTNWYGTASYTADGTTMTVYGDITEFMCQENRANLTAIDLSHNTQLNRLDCYNNNLTTLDVSGCTQLNSLSCFDNNLTTLDVSHNTQLKNLYCGDNNLTSLDLSHNTQLNTLYCNDNNLTALDLSHNTQLSRLDCSYNNLTTLDVSGCTQLNSLSCNNSNLTALDLSHNTQLTSLYCSNNNLTALDLSHNTQLNILECHSNNFSTAALDDIYCSLPDKTGIINGEIYPLENSSDPNHATVLATNKQNAIAKNWNVVYPDSFIDIPATTGTYTCPQLNMDSYITLTVAKDSAIKLDFKAAAATTPIRIKSGITDTTITVGTSWKGITSYTAADSVMTVYGDIIVFDCSNNRAKLTAIDLSHHTQLTELYCTNNKITSLYVSNNTQLTGLYCTSNQLSSLNASGCTQLKTLNCVSNQLLSLNVSGCTQLTKVECFSNRLSSLDVSGYTQLKELNCYGNQLSNINVSGCTQLKELKCYNNQLASLNISGCTQLKELYCYNNILTALDVSGCTQLTKVYCHDNKLSTDALDDIYCALPDRKDSINGVIQPVDNSSSTYNDTVIASNAANATAKNWKVQYYSNDADIATTGSYVCGTPHTKPNMDRYITLTVTNGAAIKLDFMAASAGTPIRIVSGSNMQDITVGTNWYNGNNPSTFAVTAAASTMTIYGDIIGFSCSYNGANLTALDPSHNTQLRVLGCFSNTLSSLDVSKNTQLIWLYCSDNTLSSLDVSKNTQLTGVYCIGNNFSTAALDDIYCALPDRNDSIDAGVIQPVYNSSSSYNDTVLATNAQNVTAKNWKVQYYDNTDIPATTGKHKCSATTDISEVSAEPSLTLYPNPVADVLYLSATTRTIRVYNIYGIEVAHAADTNCLEVSHLPAGVYTVRADGTVAKMVKR